MEERKPVLEGKNITVRFGDGCEYCRTHIELEKGRCPVCNTIWAARDVNFKLYIPGGKYVSCVYEDGEITHLEICEVKNELF